jgi:hypothetical protein
VLQLVVGAQQVRFLEFLFTGFPDAQHGGNRIAASDQTRAHADRQAAAVGPAQRCPIGLRRLPEQRATSEIGRASAEEQRRASHQIGSRSAVIERPLRSPER